MRIEGSNFAAANFNFQVFFQESFSLHRKSNGEAYGKSEQKKKRVKKLFTVIRAEEKKDSTQNSSLNRAVAVRER
jgi:hypothetical protein